MRQLTRAMVLVGMIGVAGASAMVFSNRATAQASTTPAPALRMATVDLLDVVERMVLSDKYKPARDAFTDTQRETLQPLIAELQALAQQGQTATQGTPEFQNLVQQYTQKQQELSQRNEAAQQAIGEFEAKQVAEAYGLVSAAANRMAERMGYTHVISTRASTTIRSTAVPGVVQEILARPIVTSPKGDDLTQALLNELQLADVKLPSEMPPVDPMAPSAAPGAAAPSANPAPAQPAPASTTPAPAPAETPAAPAKP